MAALALMSVSLWAQNAEEEEEAGEFDQESPQSSPWEPATLARGDRDAPAALVRLRDGGAIQVKVGDEWKDATLDDVAKHLKEFAEEQDREMQKDGKSAYETMPGAGKVSRLFVSLDVEPTVPWQHVLWLMMVASGQKYHKVELCEGTRKMLVSLPVESGTRMPAEPPLEIRISVHAVSRHEKVARWGDREVARPTDVHYKIGNDETTSLADVRDYIKAAHAAVKDTPNATIRGEIKAGNKVPIEKVLDVMDVFEGAGLKSVSFCGTAVPTPEVCRAGRLPFPLKNYD